MTRTIKIILRAQLGIFCAPLDGLLGIVKGLYYFIKYNYLLNDGNKFFYPTTPIKYQRGSRIMPAASWLMRASAIIMGTICVLGFAGAVAVPLPGVAPFYTISVLAIAKAIGITIGWSMLARGVAAGIGAVFDYYKIRALAAGPAPNPYDQSSSNQAAIKWSSTTSRLKKTFSVHVAAMTIFGETGHSIAKEISKSACISSTPPTPDQKRRSNIEQEIKEEEIMKKGDKKIEEIGNEIEHTSPLSSEHRSYGAISPTP